ncbi:MAG: dipeptidase [Planctomycetes bacterium]|nr:dipeptidase [Planctomycetota bacterium]
MSDDAVRSHIESRFDQAVQSLKAFCRFPSVSAQSRHASDSRACAEWLAARLEAAGLTATIEPLGRPAVLAAAPARADRPTLLVYGHYDVQPPDPLDLWTTDPFEPTVADGNLIARGASDDKGPLFAWIAAIEALRAAGEDLPVNIKCLFEGEEEIGSPSLGPFIAANTERLACDAIAIADGAFYADDTPSLTYGLRGLTYLEVKATGPDHDLHSGLCGGLAPNPLNALAAMIASLHDAGGRVAVKGFYDDVRPPGEEERAIWSRLAFDADAWRAEIGASALAGPSDVPPLERLWALPTLDCHGLWGGYTGEGCKTVIPAWAKAKLSCRLVCDQRAEVVAKQLEAHLRQHCPAGIRLEITSLTAQDPWLADLDTPAVEAARGAIGEAFEAPCALVRCGASIPVAIHFYRQLGVDPLIMGVSLPGDRVHSPNEKFGLDQFRRAIHASAALMDRLGRLSIRKNRT